MIDARNRRGKLRVPAANNQIDPCVGSERADVADGFERHHQIPDALEPQQQNAWLAG